MHYDNIREEELKNRIAQDYFQGFNATKIVGNIDFCVTVPTHNMAQDMAQGELVETESLLWAEAKKGKAEIATSIVQLILTVGKARVFDRHLPPAFLGAFDAEKIAFIPYNDIQAVFYQNDFNWNVTPSNHETKEFRQVYETVKATIEDKALQFFYGKDDAELKEFIKINFIEGKNGTSKIQIDKNNFIIIYNKWLAAVKPTILVDWDAAQKAGIIDGDFYLADLLSQENETIKEKLYVLLKKDQYELDRTLNNLGMFQVIHTTFNDKQKAHAQFWLKYERPPKEEYWDYLVERRDLLVPQDVRERKGSFFTPQIWVELSQQYLASTFGKNWQDEYYIWDCAAGTGNLLAGLTNKYNIWASTLDRQDIDVMRDRIKNGANLLESHIFQFDFLNDDFTKLPQDLQDIINDPEKRKRLVVYINPPYAEASSYGAHSIPQVANETKIFHAFKSTVGAEAMSELFAQFFVRVYKEIPDATLASFSTPKYITSEKFTKFRNFFNAVYQKGFICKSDTFDNVKGKFPIAFLIWNLENKKETKQIETDIFLNDKAMKNCWQAGTKNFYTIDKDSIAEWRSSFYRFEGTSIGSMIIVGPSMQSNNNTFITNYPAESYKNKGMVAEITKDNLIEMCIYLSIRQCIAQTWINNRDQFLYPNDGWKTDNAFKYDCFAFALFHGQNKISVKGGINHWLPFTEYEVEARDKFESNFMTDFIKGKIKSTSTNTMFVEEPPMEYGKIVFSKEATAVFDAGRAIWQQYHTAIKDLPLSQLQGGNSPHFGNARETVNASLYDIRAYFQGRNASGKMNSKSDDDVYTQQMQVLRDVLQQLADKITPKVYEYGFLKG